MKDLEAPFKKAILEITGGSGIAAVTTVQELWSGYGRLLRIALDSAPMRSVVAKQILLPEEGNHPRGWNSDRSHLRKIRSYEVEIEWYRHWSERCLQHARIPRFLGFRRENDRILLVLEDLDPAGFPRRHDSLSPDGAASCLSWLARFHAGFLDADPAGLWQTGTYWHLETRPDELQALSDEKLRDAAAAIDRRLSAARYRTLVHGDAKIANFCFPVRGDEVAMVDFQYVGGGCGMKDVAYFLGSCLEESELETFERPLLDHYFEEFTAALRDARPGIAPGEVEAEWRDLYPFAWADFHRFLEGWCPGHWKLNEYSRRIRSDVLRQIDHEATLA